jgi:transposase InsO family protein
MIANIASDDALILPHSANPAGLNFWERQVHGDRLGRPFFATMQMPSRQSTFLSCRPSHSSCSTPLSSSGTGVIVRHGRRLLVSIGVTAHSTAEWLARQILEAFPWDTAPVYLIRDRDRSYGEVFKRRVRSLGIGDRPISAGCPWQNPCVERLIGSIQRECLDYLVVINEGHLRRILAAYAHYYNDARTHLALNKNTPAERVVQRAGSITRVPHLGGLHHSFVRI